LKTKSFFESDFGSIFYNARTNCAGIIWNKPVTSEQYRMLFTKCLDMVRLYHTPYWISDLSKQGNYLARGSAMDGNHHPPRRGAARDA